MNVVEERALKMTTVVNIYDLDKRHPNWRNDSKYAYIGRPGKGLTSKFGNPFPLKDEKDRAECLKKYIDWLLNKPVSEWSFYSEVADLRGKTLVCFCAPKLCHGDILALLAELM